MLVIAGAGTGKTTVLTKRIARLVREGHARPDEILAVTYTKNAAQEMRQRVEEELRGTDLSGLRIATFHEYCNELLRENGREFGVVDDQDLWIYLRRRLRELNLKYFVRAASVSKFLEDLLQFMRHCHDELVTPEKYQEYVQRLERGELANSARDQVERRYFRRRSAAALPRNFQRVFHRGADVTGRQPGNLRPHDHARLPAVAAE